MRMLLLAAAAMLVAPAPARAEATLTTREVPLHGSRALSSAAPVRFDLFGVHWRGSGTVTFRTRSLAGRWSSWHAAAPESEDGPDRPVQPGWRIGNPYWTGPANGVSYRLHGDVTRLRAYFVWSPVDELPPRRLSIAGSPPLLSRLSWGADESIRRAPPRYADAVRFALVHHTAGTNSYSRTQSAAIVRGIEVYHVKGNGWNDIGYNFLVDKYGQVFEGRYGGVDKNVIGAHAEGFNTGSVGIAMIGTYDSSAPPPAAMSALENLLAWRLDVAHVDPLSTVTVASGGNPRYPVGVPVFLHAISGHRDTGFTACPGNALYAQLGKIAQQATATGQPKLYAPIVRGQPGGTVEFRAQLTEPLPWTVTVTDAQGQPMASGSGTSSDVDWLWDASKVAPAQYTWTISAGPDVRPASGTVGAAPVVLALKAPAAKPRTISPNGDGVEDKATIAYTLTASATVTAVLRDESGHQLATLFSEPRAAGKHTFTFTAEGVPDGRYTIVLTATDGKKTVTAGVPLIVDRTFAQLAVSPRAFSPNGDGRDDTLMLSFQLARPAHVRIDVKRAGNLVATPAESDFGAGPQSVTWDGKTEIGRAADGAYSALVTVTTPLGTTQHSRAFRVDTVPPKLQALSFRRLVFRVNEPALVSLTASRRTYAHVFRAGVFVFPLARVPRAYTISARDSAGNVSATLRSR